VADVDTPTSLVRFVCYWIHTFNGKVDLDMGSAEVVLVAKVSKEYTYTLRRSVDMFP